MSDIEKYLNGLLAIDEAVRDVQGVFVNGPLSFCVKEMVGCYQSLFSRFCPFDIGERVALSMTPDMDESPGWSSSKHFLLEGAQATVRDRGYSNGKFTFVLEFDDDSWIGLNGTINKRDPDKRSGYQFTEDDIRALSRKELASDHQ